MRTPPRALHIVLTVLASAGATGPALAQPASGTTTPLQRLEASLSRITRYSSQRATNPSPPKSA